MFAYCNNNPVTRADPSGKIIVIADGATEEEKSQYERAVGYLKQSPTAAALIERLESSEEVITVILSTTGEDAFYYDTQAITFNVYGGAEMRDGTVQSAAIGLAHEMGHADLYLTGAVDWYVESDSFGRQLLAQNVEALVLKNYETPIAKELGETFRANYDDALNYKQMNNSTHYRKMGRRSWWEYLFIWNWGKPAETLKDYND